MLSMDERRALTRDTVGDTGAVATSAKANLFCIHGHRANQLLSPIILGGSSLREMANSRGGALKSLRQGKIFVQTKRAAIGSPLVIPPAPSSRMIA